MINLEGKMDHDNEHLQHNNQYLHEEDDSYFARNNIPLVDIKLHNIFNMIRMLFRIKQSILQSLIRIR